MSRARVRGREWDWKQPNGWLKDRACREVLLELERKGELDLPPRLSQAPGGKKRVTIFHISPMTVPPSANVDGLAKTCSTAAGNVVTP